MSGWKLPWRGVRETPPTAPQEEPSALELQETGSGSGRIEVIDELGTLCRDLHTHLEVDEGVLVPISLSDRNAAAIVEATQCARERRERELDSVPPVYNFGRHSCWSGDEW